MPDIPRITPAGFAELQQLELLRTASYPDPAGVPTIGFGHTSGVKLGQTCTKAQALAWLRADLDLEERTVSRAIRVPLGPNQRDALIIFAFNIGAAAFTGSSVAHVLNQGLYDQVPDHIALWNKDRELVKGVRTLVVSRGLVNRRKAEIAIWNRDRPPAPPPPRGRPKLDIVPGEAR